MAKEFQPVTFLRRFQGYNPEDTASFENDLAEALVKSGVAEPYVAPPKKRRKPRGGSLKPQGGDEISAQEGVSEVCQDGSADKLF